MRREENPEMEATVDSHPSKNEGGVPGDDRTAYQFADEASINKLYCSPFQHRGAHEASCACRCSGYFAAGGRPEQFRSGRLFQPEGKGHHWIRAARPVNLSKANCRCFG